MKQALLVIDTQAELVEGNENEQPVYNKERLLSTINTLIEKAQQSDIEVIFIRDLDVAGGKSPGFDIHPAIHVPENSVIFDKRATNSFYGTPLLGYLREKEIQHLVIMGCQTEYCIDTAVRTATVSGFDVTLVKDGHSTTDSPVLPAEQIIQHHNKTLHGHYNVDNFSIVREASEEVFSPMHDGYRAEA
ncbi:cysteine hydrolase family protein [Bacillus sp. SJS]|uniref:cysteine hydrolase family protein n=1 Tax=Bacillus sp. SJS TaxID=1423321 RepID=UPI0004DCEE30|nr:cysteine hydrolase family protein [Bacillus sp. SJS]KZZ84105.1 isochorismatase [Bacillus sp. SJS]